MLQAGAGRVSACALVLTSSSAMGLCSLGLGRQWQSRLSASAPSPHKKAERGRGLHSNDKGRKKQHSWYLLHAHVPPFARPCAPIQRCTTLDTKRLHPPKCFCTLCFAFIFSQAAL